MDEILLKLSRHDSWATKTLLEACRSLRPDQIGAPGVAAFGSIIETLNHIVTSDAGYLESLGGPSTLWLEAARRELEAFPEPWNNPEAREPVVGLDELGSRVEESERLWETVLTDAGLDPDRLLVLDSGTYECPAWIVIAQVFQHGALHREQICAALTRFGVEPPDLQPWGFADATGLSRFLGGRTR